MQTHSEGCSQKLFSKQALSIKTLDKSLDREEIALENYRLNSKVNPVQEFEIYKDYLNGLSYILAPSPVSESVSRGLKGLSVAFSRTSAVKLSSSVPNQATNLNRSSQTEEFSDRLSVQIDHYKNLHHEVKSLDFSKVLSQLQILSETVGIWE